MEVKMTEMGENETEKMVKRAQNGAKMK